MSCIATSSTAKDDVSALLWVLGFHPNKVLRISTAQEESAINSTSTQKYKNMILCCIKLKLSPQEEAQFNFLCFYFQIIFRFFLSSVVLPSKLTITNFWNRNINR